MSHQTRFIISVAAEIIFDAKIYNSLVKLYIRVYKFLRFLYFPLFYCILGCLFLTA